MRGWGNHPPRTRSFHLVSGRPLEFLSRLFRQRSSAASAWLPALAAPKLFVPPVALHTPSGVACQSIPSTPYSLPSKCLSTAMASESRSPPPGFSKLGCSTPPGHPWPQLSQDKMGKLGKDAAQRPRRPRMGIGGGEGGVEALVPKIGRMRGHPTCNLLAGLCH